MTPCSAPATLGLRDSSEGEFEMIAKSVIGANAAYDPTGWYAFVKFRLNDRTEEFIALPSVVALAFLDALVAMKGPFRSGPLEGAKASAETPDFDPKELDGPAVASSVGMDARYEFLTLQFPLSTGATRTYVLPHAVGARLMTLLSEMRGLLKPMGAFPDAKPQ